MSNCRAIIQSGARAGAMCGRKIAAPYFCGLHRTWSMENADIPVTASRRPSPQPQIAINTAKHVPVIIHRTRRALEIVLARVPDRLLQLLLGLTCKKYRMTSTPDWTLDLVNEMMRECDTELLLSLQVFHLESLVRYSRLIILKQLYPHQPSDRIVELAAAHCRQTVMGWIISTGYQLTDRSMIHVIQGPGSPDVSRVQMLSYLLFGNVKLLTPAVAAAADKSGWIDVQRWVRDALNRFDRREGVCLILPSTLKQKGVH
jgi:hypothetical protein